MFVFKAAVVGAGTMGGEIAQAIASADVPVVLITSQLLTDEERRRFGTDRTVLSKSGLTRETLRTTIRRVLEEQPAETPGTGNDAPSSSGRV